MLYDFYFCLVHMSLSIYNGKIICLFKICRKRKKVSIWSPHLSVPICVLSGYFSQLLKGDDFYFYTLKLEQEHLIRPSVLCELLKARASRPESCYDTGLIITAHLIFRDEDYRKHLVVYVMSKRYYLLRDIIKIVIMDSALALL